MVKAMTLPSLRPACLDDEIIAALADGSLQADAAAEARAHLADCPECSALLADVLACQEELADEAGDDAPPARPEAAPAAPVDVPPAPLPFERPRRRSAPAWLPLAAVLLLGLGAGWWQFTRPRPVPVDDLVAALSAGPAAQAAPWDDALTRGGRANLAPERDAFRFGVLALDLRLSLATGNAERARARLRLCAQHLDGLAFAAADAAFLRAAAERPGGPGRAEVERRLDDILAGFDPAFAALGHWAEAARLAAAARDAAFFAAPRHRRVPAFVRRAAGPRLTPELRAQLDAIEERWPVAPAGEADWAALEALLARLLRLAGA